MLICLICFMKKLLGILIITFAYLISDAQRYERYDILDVRDGLSSNYVDCILKDSKGYTWIGTWNGLNRFDGYDIVQYKADVQDSSKLLGNWIFKVFEDRQNNLWICTNSGLCRYNYKKDCFEREKEIANISVKAIVQTTDNHLWVSSINGLIEYDFLNDTVLNHYFQRDTANSGDYAELSDLNIDNKGNLWIGTHSDGFFQFNTKTKVENHYVFKPVNSPTISNKIRTICFDNNGKLWIGSFDNGLAIFDTTTKSFDYKFFDKNDKTSIGSNAISHICTDNDGNVWVSCQNGNLNKYDPQSDSFIRFEYNSYLTNSLPSKSISFLFQDNLGIYWIGTHGYGIAQLNPLKNKFKFYRVLPGKDNALPDNRVSAFLEMNDGKIIVGTDGGGIAVFDRHKESFDAYNTSTGLGANAITDLSLGEDNQIWIATWNGGISRFDFDNKNIVSFKNNPNKKKSLNYNNTKGILYKKDTVWIATHGEGIAFYDCKKDRFTSFRNSNNEPFDLKAPTWANDIFSDSKNRLWIATYYGLYQYCNNTLKSYIKTDTDPKALSSNQIISVFEDSNKTIWVITDNGLDIYNEPLNRFEPCHDSLGLPKNVKAIIEDYSKNLWISADGKIFCYSLQTHDLLEITTHDGLPFNDYLFKSAYRLKDSSLLFGGTNGFICFNPQEIKTMENTPEVNFVDFYINNQIQIPGAKGSLLYNAISETDTLGFKYSNDVLTLHIAAFNTINPDAQNFSYLIDGYNENWIELGKDRKIILPTLSPGKYRLKIKTYLTKNESTAATKELIIIIYPNWWQTWWFKLLTLLLLLTGIVIVFRIRINVLKKRSLHLESIVRKRTRELVISNDALKEKQQVIEIKNKQLNDALLSKDQLISILAHDFKNPLNGIVGAASIIDRENKIINNQRLNKFIPVIVNSANSLSSQMIKVLDWVRSQGSDIEASPVEINLEVLLNDVIDLERINTIKKEIRVSVKTDYKSNAFVDPQMISTVFRNLLTNAIKFTERGGSITIILQEIDNSIETTFIDSGKGISQEIIDQILNSNISVKSEYGTEKEKGTGLGLKLSKSLIEKNSGLFNIANNAGKGSVFTVILPKGETKSIKHTIKKDIIDNDSESETEDKSNSTVLIIDDNTELMEVIIATFGNDYDIFRANDGEEGYAIAQQMIPDIIISDINMPKKSGIELCSAIRLNQVTSHIPLLLISSHSDDIIKKQAYESGANDFLAKPFDSAFLKKKVDALLDYKKKLIEKSSYNTENDLPIAYEDEIVAKTIKFIDDNISNSQLNTLFVAEQIGVSRSQLWRLFKKQTGKSIGDCIKEKKLQKAAAMLMTGKYRIGEVSDFIGFSDNRYFSRLFTNEYGMTPSEYAKKFCKN